MLVKVSQSFPLKVSEIHKIHRILNEHLPNVGITKYEGAPMRMHCELVTDNWEILVYPRTDSPLIGMRLGTTRTNFFGVGSIWIKPGLTKDTCTKVLVHELAHLAKRSCFHMFDDESTAHDEVFEVILREFCRKLEIPQPVKGSSLTGVRNSWPD